MPDELHAVFGGGQVGQPLARLFRERGLRVRMARRSVGAPEGAELMRGDATDRNFCLEAARGAATICHCMNSPYSAKVWAELIPKYTENLIAAGNAGARLVVLESLYMLGRPGGQPMNEDTPINPCSQKGEIRARGGTPVRNASTRRSTRDSGARFRFLRSRRHGQPPRRSILEARDRRAPGPRAGQSRRGPHLPLRA